jgi:hypothetical protein
MGASAGVLILMMAAVQRWARWLKIGSGMGLIGFALIWCAWGPGVESAAGYMLQGPHVLELMARNLRGASTLRVNQQVTIQDPETSKETVVLDETLSYIFPGQFRSESVYQNSRRIQVTANTETLTIIDDHISPNPQGRFDHYKDLLLYNTPELLQKILAISGVDVGTTTLGRSGDQIVYVVGARYPDESVSQLWVDKDQFLPLRWLTVRHAGMPAGTADRWEFVYGGWQKVDGVMYPFSIDTFHNGQCIRRIRVTKVDANAVIDKQLVDIAHLRSIYQVTEAPVPGQSPPDPGMDEVQRTIEEFKKKFEP